MKKFNYFLLAILLLVAGCKFANKADPSPVAEGGIPQAGNYELSLSNEGDTRNVVLHLPPAYDGEAQLPLIIVLHGGAGNGEQIQRLTEIDEDADEFGFVVAYPDGSGWVEDGLIFTWNAGHCCGYSLNHQADDVGFIELLIDNLVSHYAIDSTRVYIAGISNGGMMAYRAGAELADKVAAIAPIAASLGGQLNGQGPPVVPEAPTLPVAVLAFHGAKDNHVLYEGGLSEMSADGRVDLSVEESIMFWVEANGCDPQPASETQADGNIVIETYTGCEGGADVVLVTIVDGGHAWPGASRGLVSDQPTQDISANELMLEFFLAHPKE